MAKAVFIASPHSNWNDQAGVRYHFPKRNYLSIVERTLGDWVVFFAGRRGGYRGYYAAQRVLSIVDDPVDEKHAYAMLDQGSLIEFEQNVPRTREDGSRYESTLPAVRGKNSSAVRVISDEDFAEIVGVGFQPGTTSDAMPRSDDYPDIPDTHDLVFDGDDAPEPEADPRTRILFSRALRDRSFARIVKGAYRSRCAISGISIRNGGGRPEAEAAHILPVASQGPDVVQNGLALSGTVHWMFDRGLLSVGDDRSILVAGDYVDDELTLRLIHPERKLIVPDDPVLHPHPAFLKWHRDNCFKG